MWILLSCIIASFITSIILVAIIITINDDYDSWYATLACTAILTFISSCLVFGNINQLNRISNVINSTNSIEKVREEVEYLKSSD